MGAGAKEMVREILNPMVREMRYYDTAAGYSPFETPLRHQDAGAILRGCAFVSSLSSGYGQQKARSESGDCSESDFPTVDELFSGPAEPVVYPEGCESSEARTWYLIGRSEGMEQQFKNLLPAIDQAIEIAMR